MPHARGACFIYVAALAGLTACSHAPVATRVAPAAACAITGAPLAAGDTLTLAIFAPVDPAHAPVASNPDERLLFAQLYEGLIAVDCDGRPRPALARSWTVDAAAGRLTFTLRDDARFSDGAPLTAGDVVAAWRATAARAGQSAALARRIADGAIVVDDHTLGLSLPETDLPILADPPLAVYRAEARSPWPAGSGRYQVVRQEARGRLVLAPVDPDSDPVLVTRPATDARDAIDAGADVVVTDDPVAVRYAEARGGVETVPLPWTRTYALAIPPRSERALSPVLSDADSMAFRASLARDAVRAEARAAQPSFWWRDARCTVPAPGFPTPVAAAANRVVYRRDDPVARGIAERLVALAHGLTAAGLGPDDFAQALRAGADAEYVVSLPRAPASACAELAALWSATPWFASDGEAAQIVPLVDARRRAIVRQGRVTATILADGTLLFGGGRP